MTLKRQRETGSGVVDSNGPIGALITLPHDNRDEMEVPPDLIVVTVLGWRHGLIRSRMRFATQQRSSASCRVVVLRLKKRTRVPSSLIRIRGCDGS